jgi:hypothetical protein
VTGAGLANRKLDKRQRAVLAAGVLDGSVRFEPSLTQLAALFGVSTTYIMLATKLAKHQRLAIMRGWDSRSFAELIERRPARLSTTITPVITNDTPPESISDGELQHLIRSVGIERVLDAAVQVER